MSIFVRNYRREGVAPKGSSGQWFSVTLADLICLHAYTEDGINWKTKIVGAVTTEGDGFSSQEAAETFALRVARKRLQNALREIEESERDN